MIELRPGSFSNKGGELMARATVGALGADVDVAVEPWIAPYAERARLGLHQKLWVRRLGPAAGWPATLIPGPIRRRFGIVRDGDLTGVLDASGFRYTDDDRYGPRSARELATNAGRWRRQGTTLILLPQALGPFERPDVREPFLRALDAVDLVYVRDPVSAEHLARIAPGDPRIRLAPDFTIPLRGRRPDDLDTLVGGDPFVAIVPNDRMIERTSPEVGAAYLGFLEGVIRDVVDLGLRPVLVIHESTRDRAFVDRLRPALGADPRIVAMADPILLKGILGAARLVIASRYHALISAMSEGVPVVATGWTHKYATLLESFGCPGQLLDPRAAADERRVALAPAVDGPTRTAMVDALRRHTAEHVDATERMWTEVRDALRITGARSA